MFDYYWDNERIWVYLDYSNMHYTKYALWWEYDIWKFLNVCSNDKKITRIWFYWAFDPKNLRQYNRVQKLKAQFTDKKFYFYFKKLETKWWKSKWNVDTEMWFDIAQDSMNDLWDCLILFTWDGDFLYPVKKVFKQSKKISIVSTKPFIAKELVDFVNKQDPNICRYINLNRNNKYSLPIKSELKDTTRWIALYPPLVKWIQSADTNDLLELKNWVHAAINWNVYEEKTPEFLITDKFSKNIILHRQVEEKTALVEYLNNII